MVRRPASHAFVALLSTLMAVVLLFGHFPISIAATCASSVVCPCDERSEAGEDESDHACDCSEEGEEMPDAEDCPAESGDSCPDGCPDCRCATGAVFAVPGTFVLPDSLSRAPTIGTMTPIVAAPAGLPSDVFRPPRLRG